MGVGRDDDLINGEHERITRDGMTLQTLIKGTQNTLLVRM